MRAVELIVKKREGGSFTEAEIGFLVRGFTAGEIPDYQFSALLMAILLKGMSPEETALLTRAMIRSGEVIDLAGVPGPLVDKHSTGGVGDKISLVLAPLAAACGLRVPMMSGRSLGHTGGTLDKLEAIPGFRTDLPRERFVQALEEIGFAMIGQSEAVVPADRKMYALRDVTGTVESIPLITASIMSKKFAEGAEALVFDVKCGSGAFMKSLGDARALASSLVRTGAGLGRKVVAVLSDMDQPLGRKVGNFLEVEETIDCLRGRGPGDVMDLTHRLVAWMLVAGGVCRGVPEGETLSRARLADGAAWKLFLKSVQFQGGDVECILDPSRGPRAPVVRPLPSPGDGVVSRIDAYRIGLASVVVGAGRSRKGDEVFPGVGLSLQRTQGEPVRRGEPLALVHGQTEAAVEQALVRGAQAFEIGLDASLPGARVLEEMGTP
jgi:pyrimidine-nucleoside phosphorylase